MSEQPWETLIDTERACELCNGPIPRSNETGCCRINAACREESNKRVTASLTGCKICGGPIGARNKVGICRSNESCLKEARRVHDRNYVMARESGRAVRQREENPERNKDSTLLPEDGIIDEIAVWIASCGIRKVSLTHRERVEVIKKMLRAGAGVRDMCDNLHVHPSVVREILDDLGYECVRNEHIVGSKIIVILPKGRQRKGSRG